MWVYHAATLFCECVSLFLLGEYALANGLLTGLTCDWQCGLLRCSGGRALCIIYDKTNRTLTSVF